MREPPSWSTQPRIDSLPDRGQIRTFGALVAGAERFAVEYSVSQRCRSAWLQFSYAARSWQPLLTIAKSAAAAHSMCVSVGLRPLLAASRHRDGARAWLAACWTSPEVFAQSDSTFGLVAAYR